jgi:cyclase
MNNKTDYRRVIPCLDFHAGRVVKGISFVNLRDAGDPVEMARAYQEAGADELAFLDIAATNEERPTLIEMAHRVSEQIQIPFTVGGGIKTLADIENILTKVISGRGKVSLNSAAVKNPEIINQCSSSFGPESLVVAIDVAKPEGSSNWNVLVNGGQVDTGINALDWAEDVDRRGAGAILLTSMDRDGGEDGYDIPVTRAIADRVSIPVIASGGAGKLEHFAEAIIDGHADAVLAASVFHFGTFSIREVKEYLAGQNIPVRLDF